MEGEAVHFCNFSKGVNVVDANTGEYRASTLEDQKNVALLVDALDQYDLLDVAVETRDVADEIANIASYEVMAENCSKHSGQSAHNKREAEIMIEMAAVVAGGKENLAKRPITSTVVCPTSPLTISTETTEPIIVYAENSVPCTVLSMVMAGSTAPVTLAGTLVVHNAEVLAGIVLGQLTKKGAPNLYGSSTTILDLRTAAVSVGCPELAMLSAAVARLANYYNLPSYIAGG
jgi:trimethylamine--corrinoid protein Co-methyltransferase